MYSGNFFLEKQSLWPHFFLRASFKKPKRNRKGVLERRGKAYICGQKEISAMGYIMTLKANKLLGGTDNSDIYPVTATQAVFDSEGNSLEQRLKDAMAGSDTAIPIDDIAAICGA